MEVKPGYKQTEVGVIPEDWGVHRLSELGAGATPPIKAGPFGSALKKEEYVPTGFKIYGQEQVIRGDYLFGDYFISTEKYRQLESCSVNPGDVLLSLVGTVGKLLEIPKDAPKGIINPRLIRFSFDRSRVLSSYFRYTFESSAVQQELQNRAQGGTMGVLNAGILSSFEIALPGFEEQRSIAASLSDMDALLDGLDRLIAKKRSIKQAAMQQLLTGQTRLPGFSGEWKVTRLGDYVSIRNQKVLPTNVVSETLCVELEHVGQGDGHLLVRGEARNSSAAKYRFQAGDVLFGRLRSYLRKYWLATEDGICTTEIWPFMFDVENVNPGFLFALVQTEGFIETASVSYGTHMPRADWSVVRNYEVHLPSIEEQTAIATILSDMDGEIAALEIRRTKTRALKQAMMQELMTGRTRLVTPDEEAVTQTEGRKPNVHFLRSVLAAEIIDQLHDQPTFGHVKFEKMMFLAEHLCQVDTGSTYHRKAAGPYDNRALRSIDSQLQKQQWFEARKQEGRYQYVPLAKRGGHKPYFERHFSGIGETLEKILSAFKTAKTEQCEIVATLLAAWSDLLREKGTVSDEMIVHEVLHNWHEAKQRIPEDRWLVALGWMREKGFVPKGATLP